MKIFAIMCQMFSEVTCVTADRTASTYCASIARAGRGRGLGGPENEFLWRS